MSQSPVLPRFGCGGVAAARTRPVVPAILNTLPPLWADGDSLYEKQPGAVVRPLRPNHDPRSCFTRNACSIAPPLSWRVRRSDSRRDTIRHRLFQLALTVLDYDKAIAFYVGVLGFTLIEDTDLGNDKRWVRVAPPGYDAENPNGAALLLARAVTDEQRASVGNQTGGRVFLFLETDDFKRDFDLYTSRGVHFVRAPAEEPYGTVAVFADLYGNLIDLIGPRG